MSVKRLPGLIISFFVLAQFASTTNSLFAQATVDSDRNRLKIGFITGYGDQSFGGILDLGVEYRYRVHFYQLQYYYAFKNKATWSLEFLIQPQFNASRLAPIDDVPDDVKGYEFGINFGVLIRKYLFNEFVSIYGTFGVGPHFISQAPGRQTKGFIFTENILIGVNIRIVKGMYLDLRGGVRHVSNAGLQKPNDGINTIVLGAGVLFSLN